jgi:hypothetical protein
MVRRYGTNSAIGLNKRGLTPFIHASATIGA